MKYIIVFCISMLISISSAQQFYESTHIVFGTGTRTSTIEFQEYNRFFKINLVPTEGVYYHHNKEFYYDYYSGGNIITPHFRTETTYLNHPWFN